MVGFINERVNLIQMSNYNRKLYHHDGEQLGFYKKAHMKTQSKKKDVLVIFFILLVNETKNKKRRILIYLTKIVLKRTSNAIFSMKKVNLDES